MKKQQITDLKCTWTNGLIWAVITAAAAAGIRYALWYFVMWQGDPDIYFDEFATLSCWLLLAAAVFPVLFFLLSYRGYMRLAASHPEDLYGVAHGTYAKPWTLQLILLAVADVAWAFASLIIISLSLGLDLMVENDATAVMTLAALSVAGIVLDVALFGIGNKLFKPDLVRNNA